MSRRAESSGDQANTGRRKSAGAAGLAACSLQPEHRCVRRIWLWFERDTMFANTHFASSRLSPLRAPAHFQGGISGQRITSASLPIEIARTARPTAGDRLRLRADRYTPCMEKLESLPWIKLI